jgi:two-component system, sensor histidine kinase LadS
VDNTGADKLKRTASKHAPPMSQPTQISFIKKILFVFLLWIFSWANAFAADRITHRAFWEDNSGNMPFELVRSQTFTPYTGVLSQGYTQAAVWIRLNVQPAQSMRPDDKIILRIRPVYLDEIRLYDPMDTSGRERMVGDQTNLSAEEYKSLTHTFVIPAGSQSRQIFLRLKASSTSLIDVEALTETAMAEAEHSMLIRYFTVLSLITVFLIVVFLNWLNSREFLYAVFVFRHALYLIFTASFFGFHRLWFDGVIDAKYLDLIYNWLVLGATGVSLIFEFFFLSAYSLPHWARHAIHALMVWSGCAILLLAMGEVYWALKVNMALNAIAAVTLLVVALLSIKDDEIKTNATASLLPKKWVIVYYTSITALLMFSVLPFVGAVAGNEFSTNGLVYYALCSGAIMTVLMQLRANQLRQVNEKQAKDLLLSEQQVAIEKVRREEQSQLLTMLMHELKTPLSVIDLAQQASTDLNAKGYVARNVTIIKNILDRCLNADRIALGQLNVDLQPVQLRPLLEHLLHDHQSHRFTLNWQLPAGAVTVRTDYQCLQIILNNLLDNAVRYGDQTHTIRLDVQAKSDDARGMGVTITVVNKTGIAGWPEADKVFKKYYRSTGAKMISGTGLGLFLVASLARIIGATCTYAPDDTCVRFELWLPV